MRVAHLICLALLLPIAGQSQDTGGRSYSYYYADRLISLQPSNTFVAVSPDSEGIRKKLITAGVSIDPLSRHPSLAQRRIGLYRIAPAALKKKQQAEIVQRFSAAAKAAGAITQPVFEQGGALLVPTDEVLVGLAQGTDLAAAQKILEPSMKSLGVVSVRTHRKSTYLAVISDPADGRAFEVAQQLFGVKGVTFAEPNHVVVLLDDGRPPVSTQSFLDITKKLRQPASKTGRQTTGSSNGVRRTHSSVTWTTLIDESFDAGALPPGWTTGRWDATDPDVYWSITPQRSHEGTHSAHASSGGTAGVAPPADYPGSVRSWLETPLLDLAAYEEAYVEVWLYGKFDPSGDITAFDGALPYIRDTATGTLTPLDIVPWMSLLFDLTADPTSHHGWRHSLMRVPPAARHNGMQVGFVFVSDSAAGAEGLYIDQVKVVATTEVDTDPISNDTYSARQYELHNSGQIAGHGTYGNDLNILAAWNSVPVSPTVVVGVVDSGVDLGHPDLRLVTGYDFNGSVGGGSRGSHGTAVAGNVGAIRNNGIGVVGTAPGVKIMPVYRGGTYAEYAMAVDVAVSRGATLITNSWGWVGAPSADIAASVRDALGGGVAVLFAAGNGPDRPPFTYDTAFPCNLTGTTDVICIGASSPSDEYKGSASTDGSMWWGSSYVGDGPDVTAPSPWSYSTDIRGAQGYNDGSDIDPAAASSADYTPVFGGTSSATPKAAGVVALMLSANRDLTPGQVKRILRATADDIDAPGFDDRTGAGRINAFRAVAQASFEPGEPRVYHIEAVGHARLARPGNKVEADLVLAVNSSRGPVTGLSIENFKTATSPVPPGGCNVEITRVVSVLPGRYMLDIVPFRNNPSCKWLPGLYSISILVTNGTYSGAGVTNLEIKGN